MAETKKRRKGKKRGTQGGRVDNKPRAGRPRNREEAKNRAKSKRNVPAQRHDNPPTWRSSITRGLIAAVVFFVLLLLLFKRPVGVSAAFAGFMIAFYIPAGYFIDMALWRKRERARIRARQQGK